MLSMNLMLHSQWLCQLGRSVGLPVLLYDYLHAQWLCQLGRSVGLPVLYDYCMLSGYAIC